MSEFDVDGFNQGWDAAMSSMSGAGANLSARASELLSAALGGRPSPKHLTNAECAAEYWRAESELGAAVIYNGRTKIVDGMMPAMADTGGCGWRALIWHRFASHPHAHEEP